MSRRVFNLDAYSDRELVHVVAECADPEGWTSTTDVAVRAGVGEENARSVAVRFAWMRRYGIMEKEPKRHKARWRLSEAGLEMLAGANLNHGLRAALRSLKDSEIVAASHTLAGRFRDASAPHAAMTRREWQREIRARGGGLR